MHQDWEQPFRIKPTFISSEHPRIQGILSTVESVIEQMIPESVALEIREASSMEDVLNLFYRFSRQIPLIKGRSFADGQSSGLILKMLCHSQFTSGVGRYITDIFSRWLVPGKRLSTVSTLSLTFQFCNYPEQSFYFKEEFFQFTHPNDLPTALNIVPHLIEEVRINILAVYHIRYLASLKSISQDQRHQILQQQFHTLFNSPSSETEPNIYDQMHQFLIKLTEEEKFGRVKRNMNYLMLNRPESVDRDIFYEMSSFSSHFGKPFTTRRNPRHLSRLVAFHYLFKKTLLQSIQKEPHERHLSIKILKVQLNSSDPVLGILVGMHLLRETERFERKHLLNALQHCLPEVEAVPDSFVIDRREDKIRIFYLEIHKSHYLPFSIDEIRRLKRGLPDLLKRAVENIIHPIFMPRNEEEVLRNIVLLSKQIKFLRDLPHLTIHYEKQSDAEISFLIVLVRLLKENDLPFKELSREASIRIMIDEIRSAGSLKRRFPKEAVVFRAIIDKASFFRKDFSLDLKKARQRVAAELKQFLGEFRDYNGGMIHKQDEALEQLRKALGSSASHHEVLLENFFYSLRPGIMQTIHAPETLRTLFSLLLEVLSEDLIQKGFVFKVSEGGKYFFSMIGAAAPTFKEEAQTAIARLKIPSYDLTTTFLHIQDFAILGHILRTEDSERRTQFQQSLLDAMLKWKINFSCEV